jgi:hypothetical protein
MDHTIFSPGLAGLEKACLLTPLIAPSLGKWNYFLDYKLCSMLFSPRFLMTGIEKTKSHGSKGIMRVFFTPALHLLDTR